MDETYINYRDTEHFMWGAILSPIDCDIGLKLGRVRKNIVFLHTLHFSDSSTFDDKERKTIKGFLTSFIQSSACFRGILVNSTTWKDISDHKSQARLAGLLLSYPWMPYEDKIYKTLSRARIIFDSKSFNLKQQKEFLTELNKMLKKDGRISGVRTYPIKDASLTFADKKIFDELQLVDLVNGIIRISYLTENDQSVPEEKKEIHDSFLENFPSIRSFVKINRNLTDQKMNVWPFEPTVGSI